MVPSIQYFSLKQNSRECGCLLLLDLFVDNVLAQRWVVLFELKLLFYTLSISVVVPNVLRFRALYFYQVVL